MRSFAILFVYFVAMVITFWAASRDQERAYHQGRLDCEAQYGFPPPAYPSER